MCSSQGLDYGRRFVELPMKFSRQFWGADSLRFIRLHIDGVNHSHGNGLLSLLLRLLEMTVEYC